MWIVQVVSRHEEVCDLWDQSFYLNKSDVPKLSYGLNKLKQQRLEYKIFVVVSKSSNKHLVIKSDDDDYESNNGWDGLRL